MAWIECVRCEKLQREFVAQTFALIALVHPALHPVSCSYETIPNAPKPYATYQNMILWSNGMDQVCSLRKITKWLRGTNLCTNCTSSPHFASSFMQLRSDPKCTQTLCNTPKHEFMVQWGRSGAFVAKKFNVTSSHELLHQLHYLTLFARSPMKLRNDRKCTQTLCNTPKHEFMVQWGRSGAFVAKNYNVTSWHELLY